MKRVGVISIYDLSNLGNRLQNYALNKILKDMSVSCINIVKEKRSIWIKVLIKMIVCGEFNEAKRIIKFKLFDHLYIKNHHYNKKNSYISYCDIYICGSDQIWNPMIFDKWYFADFVNHDKISYAASFGVNKLPNDMIQKYREEIKKFDKISVREKEGQEIIKNLIGKNVDVLIDPTMLIKKEDWKNLERKPCFINSQEKYILTYFIGTVEKEYIDYICNIADKYKCKIINLHGKEKNKYWYSVGPSEFLWLVDNSKIVCTDSFHGSVFSILFEKEFIVFERHSPVESMNSRIETLLDAFELCDRKFNNQTIEQAMKKDYSHVPTILEREREKAINFLKNAMEIE